MVEKKFRDMLHLQVDSNDLRFTHHGSNLEAYYDEALLQANLPPTSGVLNSDEILAKSLEKHLPEATVEALRDTEFVGVYGRVVKDKSGRGPICLQYLYVWDYQAVPEHEGDYEPIFVFLDGDQSYAVYDLVHYCSRRLDLNPADGNGPGLRVVPGWHSFLPAGSLSKASRDEGITVKPLSDKHLEAWWNIPEEEARLKIDDFMRDPFLLGAPGHFMKNPDADAKMICCTFLEIEKAMKEYESPKEGFVEGIKRALSKCVGLFGLFKLGAFSKLLTEMNDVGLVKLPRTVGSGLDFGAIASILKDGMIGLTNAGQTLFGGFRNNADEDDEGK